MKNKSIIHWRISEKHGNHNLKRRRKKQSRRKKGYKYKRIEYTNEQKNALRKKLLPTNLSFLLSSKSDFNQEVLENIISRNSGVFLVPKNFSLIDNPKETYKFIRSVTASIINQHYKSIQIDYGQCDSIGLGAQVLLDIILKDAISYLKKCEKHPQIRPFITNIEGINVQNENVRKMLYSVGSPAIHSNSTIKFVDIVPYRLCIHDREQEEIPYKVQVQKDIDTTTLADYVIDSLKRVNKILSPERIDDLCTVIGEVLINAEEHSTTKFRFSIGYFHEVKNTDDHHGVFKLVILNFGNTIYEKFKDPQCPNPKIVESMRKLSEDYTRRRLFILKEFEEETLWTLYALQEGVSSVAPSTRRRGSGSISFIESFFNLKGDNAFSDYPSRLTILSGNTVIEFDGTYKISQNFVHGEKFKVMTFNDSGKIEDKPDQKFVKFVEYYFPGTLISADILFYDDILEENGKQRSNS